MSTTAIDVPPKVGFSFDLSIRNEMILKKGVQLPSYQKMGMTIIDLIFQDGFPLMDTVGLVEGAFFELTHRHQLGVKEEIRNLISALETDLMSGCEKSTSALVQLEKYRDARQEMDRKLDTQYQRKIAEALDNHLTAVQRDHELRSQIEERRIRSDASFEAVRRKFIALQVGELRQEKAKAEAEQKEAAGCKRKRAEDAKIVALEAERKVAKVTAEREATETSKRVASEVAQKEVAGPPSKRDFSSSEKQIARWIKQITGTKECQVRAKANELIKILNDPRCPQSISLAAFAEKVVSQCERPTNAAFACAHVIVLVTSQVPHAMDILLAEFHRACIYTAPKHIYYAKSAFESKEAYYKIIGYREDNGKIESDKDYLKRLESYMKLYGALVQTEVEGIQNMHGLKEGWAWLAKFLNAIPANIYTAVALEAFLKVAGFALFRKYKSQFRKMLNVVGPDFLNALKEQDDLELKVVIVEIQSYIEDKKFLEEPEGWRLQGTLLSSVMVPESDHRESYHPPSSRYVCAY